jgi:hypothetical protein
MKKQVPAILLAILLAIMCSVLALLLHRTLKENARLTAEREASAAVKAEPSTLPERPLPADTAALASADAADERGPSPPGVDAEAVEQTLKNHQRVMTSIAKMRDNPTMNKVLEASQRGTIGALYADMIEHLDLTPEETRYFMDLLMYRQMENVDFGMKLMSGQMSEGQKEERAANLRDVHDDMYAQMKAFLNNDADFKEFEYYEKTMNERMALSQMDQALAGTDEELSDQSYRELLDMMHQQSRDFDWSTDLHDQESTDLSAERFSAENRKQHTADVYKLADQILKQADGMLTPAQLESFKASLMQTTDMQIAQFQMIGQLLGGGE